MQVITCVVYGRPSLSESLYPTNTMITQLTVSKIIRISNFSILSCRMKKAIITVTMGVMLLTTPLRVKGRYLLVAKLIKFVRVP